MREILFRAKTKNSGRWAYGDLVTQRYNSRQGTHIYEKNNKMQSGYQFVRIDKKTICQYTGVKDKNGKKIFEGDIVRRVRYSKMADISKYKDEKDFEKHKDYLIKECNCIFDNAYEYHQNYDYTVKWLLNGFYPFADSPENCGHCGGAEDASVMEVVGNIHDNPELSKKENE